MRSKFQSLEFSSANAGSLKALRHSSSVLSSEAPGLNNPLRRHHKNSRASALTDLAPSSPGNTNFIASDLAISNQIANTTLVTSNSLISNSIFSDVILADTVYLPWNDNSMADARTLGTLTTTKVTSGSVGTLDTQDYFKFSLGAANQFRLHLTGLAADADVQLLNSSGGVVGSSTRTGTNSELISYGSLGAGDYYVRVYQFSGDTNYNLSLSTVDWYDQNLSDAGLIGQARSLYYPDGSLSRNDMIGILREAKDYGSIDSTELNDLRKIVSASTGFSMPNYVRVLANKVVNSDPANPRSGIGNLFAGSADWQMERLVGKWFLGADRPTAISFNRTTVHGYRYASGSLFQNGISHLDVDQNDIGDCYFMASLGATAHRTPGAIQDMFIDNQDGTFTVRFFNNGAADYVTVDRFLPTDTWGNAVFAGWGGGANTETDNELWVALAEKAYAQINESGWIGQDNTNSYNGVSTSATAVSSNSGGLNGGWPYNAMRHITGRNTGHNDVSWRDWWSIFITTSNDLDTMVSKYNSGQLVVLNTKDSGVASGIVANHSYTMVGYNSYTQRFRLYNPWGSEVELTRNQIVDNFNTWDYTA